MPTLRFSVQGAAPVPYAASPLLAFMLKVDNDIPGERVHSVILQCQIRIEAPRRGYEPSEQARLSDLFGQPERWTQTLRGMLWTHVNASVADFTGSTLAEMLVPCTFDFNVAAAKYFHALDGGTVPICLLFSGTIFYESGADGLQVARIPWNTEANYSLPVAAWREVVDMHYPNSASLTLRRDVFNRLDEYRQRNGMLSWEEAMEGLLVQAEHKALA